MFLYLLFGAAAVSVIDNLKRIDVTGATIEFQDIEKLESDTSEEKEQIKKENPRLKLQRVKSSQDLIDKVFELGSSPSEALGEIDKELRKILKKLANKAGVAENAISEKVLVESLTNEQVIAGSVASLLLNFLTLVKKITLQHNDLSERQLCKLQRLTDIGLNIIELLNYESSILSKPEKPKQPVEINSAGISIKAQPKQKKITFYLTVVVVDEDRNIFPAKVLTENNFKITEHYDEVKTPVSILSVKPLAQTETPFKAVFAIDSSASMGESPTSGEKKISKVKGSSRFLIKRLLDYCKQGIDVGIAVLKFSGNIVSTSDFMSINSHDIYMNKLKDLNTAIDKIVVGGNTPLWQAVDFALDSCIQERGYKVIICLTDGMNTPGSIELENLIEKVKLLNIPIFTIVYGYGKEIAPDGLIQLAEASKAGKQGIGSFINVSPSDISKVFDNIGDTLVSTYEVYCEANTYFLSGQSRKFDIKITYDGFIRNETVDYTIP